jgi:hypothetical protein
MDALCHERRRRDQYRKSCGFYSSFQYVTLISGQICALIMLLLLQKVFLTAEEIRAPLDRIDQACFLNSSTSTRLFSL